MKQKIKLKPGDIVLFELDAPFAFTKERYFTGEFIHNSIVFEPYPLCYVYLTDFNKIKNISKIGNYL